MSSPTRPLAGGLTGQATWNAYCPHAGTGESVERQSGGMIGRRIGNYRLRKVLGRGGMAEVFLGFHVQIHRPAAIKVLLPDLARDPAIVSRFLDEARAVNLVRHRGLVDIFDFGLMEDRSPYIIMEYLEGETLAARCDKIRGSLDLHGVRLCQQIAAALTVAHRKGVIHRDLKPANILIIPDRDLPGGERAKVLDFGIAKFVARETRFERTERETFMGTPAYMAPEQFRDAASVNDRVDVYALGVILYQILTGFPPFVTDNWAQMVAMHLRDTPRPLRERNPAVPAGLAVLVHSMLAKQPADRPTMSRVAAELEGPGDDSVTEQVDLVALGIPCGDDARRGRRKGLTRWVGRLAAVLLGLAITLLPGLPCPWAPEVRPVVASPPPRPRSPSPPPRRPEITRSPGWTEALVPPGPSPDVRRSRGYPIPELRLLGACQGSFSRR